MNPILQMCLDLAARGLHPDAITADAQEAGRWLVRVRLDDWQNAGGGLDLPEHHVSMNLRNLPEGVNFFGWQRWPDEERTVEALDWEMERWIGEVAREGQAVDWARFDKPGGASYLTKPNRWRRQRTAKEQRQ